MFPLAVDTLVLRTCAVIRVMVLASTFTAFLFPFAQGCSMPVLIALVALVDMELGCVSFRFAFLTVN